MNDLVDRVAIVVGASSGIGYATAELFARAGAKVVVGARRKTQLDQLVEKIGAAGGQAIAVAGDVTEEDYANAVVDAACRHFGGVDVAVNNVGNLGAMGPTTELSA
ncbi:MAG: SDR family NAD(P)-dependent oxidoreductase, partial [Gammaproteobacteria bacterium]|nr:SDR family NAD(P)-dependent oxidoreductase [Gammaproteobacteria bacterium]